MTSDNLERAARALRALRVSDQFLLGAMFLVGGLACQRKAQWSDQYAASRFLRLFPNNITQELKSVRDRLPAHAIKCVVEESLFKMDFEIQLRRIEKNGRDPFHIFSLQSYDFLPEFDVYNSKLKQISDFYFSTVEKIGAALFANDIDYSQSALCGVSFFDDLGLVDSGATDAVLEILSGIAPPALNYIFSMPYIDHVSDDMLPTQMAFWGLLAGVEKHFVDLAWPYQSWMLYDNQRPISGLEDVEFQEFFKSTYSRSSIFGSTNAEHIRNLARSQNNILPFPAYSGAGSESDLIYRRIGEIWGYQEYPSGEGRLAWWAA